MNKSGNSLPDPPALACNNQVVHHFRASIVEVDHCSNDDVAKMDGGDLSLVLGLPFCHLLLLPPPLLALPLPGFAANKSIVYMSNEKIQIFRYLKVFNQIRIQENKVHNHNIPYFKHIQQFKSA